MKKITLLLVMLVQFSFAQSISQFIPSELYTEHVACTSSGSTYNSYDLENNILTIQTDDATISKFRFTAQIRLKNAADKGLRLLEEIRDRLDVSETPSPKQDRNERTMPSFSATKD